MHDIAWEVIRFIPSNGAKLVFARRADLVDHRRLSYVSDEQLAEEVGQSVRNVGRCNKLLVLRGYMKVVLPRPEGFPNVVVYSLLVPSPHLSSVRSAIQKNQPAAASDELSADRVSCAADKPSANTGQIVPRSIEESGLNLDIDIHARALERFCGEFWPRYPHPPGDSESKARDAFLEIALRGEDLGFVIQQVDAYRTAIQSRRNSYVMYAVNWLRDRRYQDVWQLKSASPSEAVSSSGNETPAVRSRDPSRSPEPDATAGFQGGLEHCAGIPEAMRHRWVAALRKLAAVLGAHWPHTWLRDCDIRIDGVTLHITPRRSFAYSRLSQQHQLDLEGAWGGAVEIQPPANVVRPKGSL